MPGNAKKLSIERCTKAIDNFLNYAETQNRDKLGSLSEIIFYYMGHKHPDTLMSENQDKTVTAIKAICDEKNQTTHSNFLYALTASCYKHASYVPIEQIILDEGAAARIVSSFHHELFKNPKKAILFTADLYTLSQLPEEKRLVLLFCTNTFAPDITIDGNFVHGSNSESNREELKNIIEALTTKISFTYINNCLGEIGPDAMPVFLQSLRKSSRLVLDNAHLDQWTADNWKDFVDEIEQNQHLISLSLNNTYLKSSCADPEKLNQILRLFAIPQLKKLTLYSNNLSELPHEQSEQLLDAVEKSTIERIGLIHFSRVNKGSASTSGIFAPSSFESSNLTLKSKNVPGFTPRSEEKTVEEFRI